MPTGEYLFDVPESWRRVWPGSILAGCTVSVAFAENGDLTALRVNRDDIEKSTDDLESAELTAAVERFAGGHPAIVRETKERGEDDAKAAATWATDGNADVEERARVLQMLRDGDPAAWDYLPREPNLSGEFADSLTPNSLATELVSWSDTELTPELIEEISEAYEEGVSEAFGITCERELIKFIED